MASAQQPGPSLARPTRNQLDDLEQLMERMLALPVSPCEGWPTAAAALDQAPGSMREFVQIRQWAAPAPSNEPGPSASTLESSQPFAIQQSTATPKLIEQTTRILLSRLEQTPVPAAFGPVIWINDAFDWSIGWLGPAGRFLIGPRGRGLLAWTGLLLAVAALAWIIAEGLGLDLIDLWR
jgi:hypothetical protein